MTIATDSTASQTVAELVLAAQDGDRDAQSALYERYQGAAFSQARELLRDWDEAQELVQEVFIRVFDCIGQLRTPEAFSGWLRQIVRNMAINQLARRRPTVSIEGDFVDAAGCEAETPLDQIVSRERGQHLRESLTRLKEIDRQTLEAFYLQGLTLNDMAVHFNAPVGTIKRRLHTARKQLAAEIGDFHAI